MNKEQQFEKILDERLPAIRNGEKTAISIAYKYPKESNQLLPRLEGVMWLVNAGKTLEPRPGFLNPSRKYLEQRIQSMPNRSPWQRLFRRHAAQRWILNIASPVFLIIILVLVVNNLILTARLSIPGEPFYSTKLFIEEIQLAFTFNPESKTDLYVQFSRQRAGEFVELVLEGDYAMLPAAADRMEGDIIAALRSLNDVSRHNSAIENPMATNLKDTLSNEILMLKVLRDTSPSSARHGIDVAIQVAQSGVLALH
jgi:hypothetical protein